MTRGRRLLIHPLVFSAWNESAAQASTHRRDNPSMSGNSTRHWFQWHTSAGSHGQHIQGDRLVIPMAFWCLASLASATLRENVRLRRHGFAVFLPASCIIKITVLRLQKHTKSPGAAASNSFQSNRTVSDLNTLEIIPTELLSWKLQRKLQPLQDQNPDCNSNTCPHAAQATATCRFHVAFSRLHRGSGPKYWAKDAERSWDSESLSSWQSLVVGLGGHEASNSYVTLGIFPDHKVGWLKFEVHGARAAAQVSLSFAGWKWDNMSCETTHSCEFTSWYLMNLRIILGKLLGIKQFNRDLPKDPCYFHGWVGHPHGIAACVRSHASKRLNPPSSISSGCRWRNCEGTTKRPWKLETWKVQCKCMAEVYITKHIHVIKHWKRDKQKLPHQVYLDPQMRHLGRYGKC